MMYAKLFGAVGRCVGSYLGAATTSAVSAAGGLLSYVWPVVASANSSQSELFPDSDDQALKKVLRDISFASDKSVKMEFQAKLAAEAFNPKYRLSSMQVSAISTALQEDNYENLWQELRRITPVLPSEFMSVVKTYILAIKEIAPALPAIKQLDGQLLELADSKKKLNAAEARIAELEEQLRQQQQSKSKSEKVEVSVGDQQPASSRPVPPPPPPPPPPPSLPPVSPSDHKKTNFGGVLAELQGGFGSRKLKPASSRELPKPSVEKTEEVTNPFLAMRNRLAGKEKTEVKHSSPEAIAAFKIKTANAVIDAKKSFVEKNGKYIGSLTDENTKFQAMFDAIRGDSKASKTQKEELASKIAANKREIEKKRLEIGKAQDEIAHQEKLKVKITESLKPKKGEDERSTPTTLSPK